MTNSGQSKLLLSFGKTVVQVGEVVHTASYSIGMIRQSMVW